MSEATRAARWTIWLSLAAVSLTAAVASYLHALTVVQAADGRTAVAWFIAALADPAIFAASVNIIDASRRGDGQPWWSWVAIAVAVAVTLGMNVAAGSPRDIPSWCVNVWPPVAFLLALESLMSYVRRGRGGAGVEASPAVPATPRHLEPPEPPTTDAALALLLATGSRRGLAEALGVPKSRVDTWAARLSRSSAAAAADAAGAVGSADPSRPCDPAGEMSSPLAPPRPAILNGQAGG
jgi:hypothetical protein